MEFSVKSNGKFIERIQSRINKWSGLKLAACLKVSEDLKWWYWNEYGTATYSEKAPTGPYSIDPKNTDLLIFPDSHTGEAVYTEHVTHPGIKPSRSVTKVWDEIVNQANQKLSEAFEQGALDNPQILKQAILDAVALGKELIVQSMAVNLPGYRDENPPISAGRLGGLTASQVFEAEARVVDKGEEI